MYYSIDEFIRKHDKEDNVKKAIADCLTQNMTKEVALDILAHDLQARLYDYIWSDPDLNIDDGSNVRSDFTKEIKNILSNYFDSKNQTNKEAIIYENHSYRKH